MNALLAAHNLTKHYKDVIALNNVSFDISEGITGILGENGAGKSTAIKIFLGLLQPTSGSAKILGENASENLRRIAPRPASYFNGLAMIGLVRAVSVSAICTPPVPARIVISGVPSGCSAERAIWDMRKHAQDVDPSCGQV